MQNLYIAVTDHAQ